nr:hypothetical protein [Bacillus thuringiensis]
MLSAPHHFFSSTLYPQTKQHSPYAPNIYPFQKLFIHHPHQQNYPLFQQITPKHSSPSPHIIFYHQSTHQL